jgi:myo-inositol-1(or 4)-monophosphatase
MHPMLTVALKAARRAGRIITRAAIDIEAIKVGRKQQNDFVTEVDHASEQVIVETLLTAYPDHAILAEESGLSVGPKAPRTPPADLDPAGRERWVREAEHVWIIDPLDGTTNFIHGLPQYAVSIALMERGAITQALVYDPNRDELFTATKGRGAFLNDRRIRVSRRTKLEESLIGTGFPFRQIADVDRYLRIMRAFMEKTAGVRRPGAAALDLAYVACGRYDGFFELGLAPWDVAAGALLVAEAGGLIGDFRGEPNHLFGPEVVAASPRVFGAMLPVLGG